ncbi:MAG: BatD family protein [Opitutaceae bacterium]
MKTKNRLSLVALWMAACALAATAHAAAPEVTAQLDRTEIALGDSAQLTLTVPGTDIDGIAPPTVPGLEFVDAGQSSQYQFINGAVSANISVTYDVIPQHAGNFTIPPLSRGSQPLILHVLDASGTGNAPATGNMGSGLPPPVTSGLNAGTTPLTADGAAFVRLRLPKTELYVGETVPVEIQVGLRPGIVADINGLPTLNGDAFILGKLAAQPDQSQEVIQGQTYTVLTWHAALAAVKSGEFSLSVETPLTVRVRAVPQRRLRPAGGAFADPMFDDFFSDSVLQNFFGGTTEKQITVASEPDALKILALPAAGRPAGFSGAVGNFEVSSELSAARAVAGDPLTLRLKVTGTGSFDRVNSPMLGDVAGWRTYRPTAKFAPADSAGYGGEKTFEQAVIPEQPGRRTVPGVAFSFFNPATRRYETKLTAPLSVAVSPAPAGSATPLAPALVAVPAPTGANPHDGLRQDHVETGSTVATLRPLYFQPWFVGTQGVLVLCFAGGLLALRQRERRAGDVGAAQRRQAAVAVAHCLTEMTAAAAASDAARFFSAARAALQASLGARWHVAPASITLADLDARLNGDGSGIRGIFSLADEAAYSGQHLNAADFQQWMETVRDQLRKWEEL